MNSASVSVIIVNWNHGGILAACLEALLAQDFPRFDVVVVDNNSTDNSPDWIAQHYPAVRLIRFPENRGFSVALNQGITCTSGSFILSLNPDVVLRPDAISAMVRVAERDERIGMVAPKLLRASDPALLDSTGLFIDRRRRPYDRGQGQPDRGQYDAQPNVFGACGAAALFRRIMLEDLSAGGECFDQDFFAYYEDADLAWRAHLRGWRGAYVPKAVATHDRGWGDTLRKPGRESKGVLGPRLALRNRYLMTIKNDSWIHFLADFPRMLAAELPRLAYTVLVCPTVLLGLLDLVLLWPAARRKRRWIRDQQVVEDADVRRWFIAPEEMAAG